MLKVVMLRVLMLSGLWLSVFMLNVAMLSVIMLTVIILRIIMKNGAMLCVVKLNVVAPFVRQWQMSLKKSFFASKCKIRIISFFSILHCIRKFKGAGKTMYLLSTSFRYRNGYIWQAILT